MQFVPIRSFRGAQPARLVGQDLAFSSEEGSRGSNDLVTLAAMLGHSRIQMVSGYAHPTQQHQAQAMQGLEQFVSEQKIAYAEQKAPAVSHAIQ